ncbi:hypothetical protein BKA80DRAFT_282306 [Phyllosticta citrichinensis]
MRLRLSAVGAVRCACVAHVGRAWPTLDTHYSRRPDLPPSPTVVRVGVSRCGQTDCQTDRQRDRTGLAEPTHHLAGRGYRLGLAWIQTGHGHGHEQT